MNNQVEINGVSQNKALSDHATEVAVLVAITTYKQAVD